MGIGSNVREQENTDTLFAIVETKIRAAKDNLELKPNSIVGDKKKKFLKYVKSKKKIKGDIGPLLYEV